MGMRLGLLCRSVSSIPDVPGSGLVTRPARWAGREGTGPSKRAARQGARLARQSTQLAWQGGRLVTTPVRQTASALVALPGMTEELAGAKRRVWTFPGRVHVRLRGSYGPAAHHRRETIERTLEA